jgi:5'-nucleotidase
MKKIVLFCVLLLAAAGLRSPLGAQAPVPQGLNYHILVANDDGVRAPGIAAIAQALQSFGTVHVIAPSENQSGKGHSIVTSEPVFREDITLPNGLRAIGLTATPASVVNIAVRNIMTNPRPDLVVSGINRGYNLAYSAYLSGTIGAAREAAMHGIPAIAASLAESAAPQQFVYAAEEVWGVVRRLKERQLRKELPPNTFLNVNVPPMPQGGYKGYLVTTQAMMRGGQESFEEAKDPRTGRPIYFNVYKEGATAPQGTDIWAVENGYVSVTPMRIGEHDAAFGKQLEGWFK